MPPKRVKKTKKERVPCDFEEGEIIFDTEREGTRTTEVKRFILGPVIGQGGFGKIHLAKEETNRSKFYDRVIKFEFAESGPLFCEHHFFLRVGSEKDLATWKKKKSLKLFGFPTRYAYGRYKKDDEIYRFLVLGRYGEDVEKVFNEKGRHFSEVIVAQLAINLINVLEFIHTYKYVHADIKGSNILCEYRDRPKTPTPIVYLVDYGLATKYSAEYKEYKAEKHNGTKEFTSRFAHKGAKPSRSGDMEILAYCLLQWSEGVLSWENTVDPEHVFNEKEAFFRNLKAHRFESKAVGAYFTMISLLGYADEPTYEEYVRIFENVLRDFKQPLSPIDFYGSLDHPKTKKSKSKQVPDDSDSEDMPNSSRKRPKSPRQISSKSRRDKTSDSTQDDITQPCSSGTKQKYSTTGGACAAAAMIPKKSKRKDKENVDISLDFDSLKPDDIDFVVDDELRPILLHYNINAPITDSSSAILRKKLKKKIQKRNEELPVEPSFNVKATSSPKKTKADNKDLLNIDIRSVEWMLDNELKPYLDYFKMDIEVTSRNRRSVRDKVIKKLRAYQEAVSTSEGSFVESSTPPETELDYLKMSPEKVDWMLDFELTDMLAFYNLDSDIEITDDNRTEIKRMLKAKLEKRKNIVSVDAQCQTSPRLFRKKPKK